MNSSSRFILRSSVSMMLILGIVLTGFTLILIRQDVLHSFEYRIERQIQNATAKKDLGELVVSDLRKVATHFHMILFSADEQQQKLLLEESRRTFEQIYTTLDILSEGGTLSRDFPLNLTDKEISTIAISYAPQHRQQYNVAVLTLRPQLVLLQEKIRQTVAITAERNQRLNEQQGDSLQAMGLELRIYAKGVHARLERLTENANKLAYDANEELSVFYNDISVAKKKNQRIDALWAVATIFSVFGLVALVYRQTISSQKKLEHTVTQLQQTEQELQETHVEVLALNRSLEEKVVIRTEELQRSEHQWSKAFDAVGWPIFLHDKNGRITKTNRAYLDRAGSTIEEVFGQFYWKVFPKQDGALAGCINDFSHNNTAGCADEMDIVVDDQIYRSQAFVINGPQGDYLYSMHLMEDVTEKRRVSDALIQSEKRFRDVTNSMDEVLILLGTDLRIQLLNKAARKIYGVEDDDYIGRPCHEVFWDCNDICEHCPTLEVMANGKVARAMRHMPDGRILARSIYPVYDNDGDISACAVLATDVTEREKHLEELTRYEQILSTNTDLIAYYDRNHMCLAINNVMAEYYNTTADKLIGKHASEIIGQDRYQHYLQYQDTIFKQKKQFSFTSWIDFPATGLVHMQITFTPYVDEDGSASGVVARLKNITEQTEQEAKLNLSAKVFETTTEGITITDKDGTIEAVNPAFCRITGYSEAEILGENPRLLKSGRHDDTYYKTMWQALEQSGHWQGEIWNKKKDGTVYPEWLTINAMYDDDDQVKHYVAVFTDMTTMNEFIQKLEYQTHHHPLTGLPNRLLLQVRLEHSIQRATKGHYQGAVFCIDLDNFKHINDSLGHAAGDAILLEVADRLKEHSRALDTVAHLSADEFILVLDKVHSTDDAVKRAEQFLHRLSQPFMIDNYELFVTASLGITLFPADGDNVDELLKHADVAMHKAKESGKNGYHIYSSELTDAALERVVLESNLRRALDNKEFILHYQPQVVLPEGKIIACEVLVRWLHPEMGLIPPDKFIPLSEETGIIIAMGEWILRTACQQWVAWNNQGLGLGKIAVNLSGRQIQQQDLPRMIQRILQETGCPAEALELEITEGFMMQHPEQAIAVLEQINALGVELSVDDFGTGHSSLNYLKRFPIHRLKIDRSFIRDMEHNADDHAIVKTIIAMGNSLNLKITAEGIETEEQKNLLADLHCDEAQGYLFSKPVPADEFAELL